MQTFTKLRRAREEFRDKLLKLIIQDEPPEGSGDVDVIPSAHEKKVLRYYFYLNYGIETVHVAPLDVKIIARYQILKVTIVLSP